MKKFLSMLLALVMVLSLGTVAFAAEVPTGSKDFTTVVDDSDTTEVTENEASFDVKTKADVKDGANYADIVYSVKVEWTVTGETVDVLTGGLYKWNPGTLKYELEGEEGDKKAYALGEKNSVDVEIKLTNSSNAKVNYDIAYADNDAEDDALTTSEAAKKIEDTEDFYAKSATVANADTIEGAATAADAKTGHDYTINATKITGEAAGATQTATYQGTVTIESIADGATITDEQELKLGTYTVTLSAYVAPAVEP